MLIVALTHFPFHQNNFQTNTKVETIPYTARGHAHTQIHMCAHTHARPRYGTHTGPNARGARLRTPTTSDATRAAAHTSQPQGYARSSAHKHTGPNITPPHTHHPNTLIKTPRSAFIFFTPTIAQEVGGVAPNLTSRFPTRGNLSSFPPILFPQAT